MYTSTMSSNLSSIEKTLKLTTKRLLFLSSLPVPNRTKHLYTEIWVTQQAIQQLERDFQQAKEENEIAKRRQPLTRLPFHGILKEYEHGCLRI